MHYLFFVTFDKNKAKTSEEAREYVTRHIFDDGIGIEGQELGIRSDQFWYVIDRVDVGGRWSGLLSGGIQECLARAQEPLDPLGNEDDAQILTRGVYKHWLEPIELDLGSARGTHVSLEGEGSTIYMTGQKWIVVVDGHFTDFDTIMLESEEVVSA